MAVRETPIFDALPYYDDDANADPDLALKVRQELARERKKLGQRVAPDHDPRIPPQFLLFATNPLLAAELERVENHERINAIDTTRFSLPPPPNPETATMEDWKAALKNARAQLEHQRLRNTNGALLQQYGANAWKVHNYRLEMVGKYVEKALEEMNERITEVNRSRKNLQLTAGRELTTLEQKWTELISSILQIEMANATLEEEIMQLSQREAELESLLATS